MRIRRRCRMAGRKRARQFSLSNVKWYTQWVHETRETSACRVETKICIIVAPRHRTGRRGRAITKVKYAGVCLLVPNECGATGLPTSGRATDSRTVPDRDTCNTRHPSVIAAPQSPTRSDTLLRPTPHSCNVTIIMHIFSLLHEQYNWPICCNSVSLVMYRVACRSYIHELRNITHYKVIFVFI